MGSPHFFIYLIRQKRKYTINRDYIMIMIDLILVKVIGCLSDKLGSVVKANCYKIR